MISNIKIIHQTLLTWVLFGIVVFFSHYNSLYRDGSGWAATWYTLSHSLFKRLVRKLIGLFWSLPVLAKIVQYLSCFCLVLIFGFGLNQFLCLTFFSAFLANFMQSLFLLVSKLSIFHINFRYEFLAVGGDVRRWLYRHVRQKNPLKLMVGQAEGLACTDQGADPVRLRA